MKRGDLIRHLRENGCVFNREGGRHSVWVNPNNRGSEAVPRHQNIGSVIARSICRGLGIPDPPGR